MSLLITTNGRAPPQANQTAPGAVPLDPGTAIFDAFREHPIVGIGDAHGDRQGEAFQLALIRGPRFRRQRHRSRIRELAASGRRRPLHLRRGRSSLSQKSACALLLYGAARLFRKGVSQSVVTNLEKQTTPFTVWTNAATQLAALQPDVATWPVPSLAHARGTTLGRVGLATYLGPNAGDVSPQWLAPMQDQFDAVLYLGPLATITLDRPKPWPCAEPAFNERLRRLDRQRPGMAQRVKAQCLQHSPDAGARE